MFDSYKLNVLLLRLLTSFQYNEGIPKGVQIYMSFRPAPGTAEQTVQQVESVVSIRYGTSYADPNPGYVILYCVFCVIVTI